MTIIRRDIIASERTCDLFNWRRPVPLCRHKSVCDSSPGRMLGRKASRKHLSLWWRHLPYGRVKRLREARCRRWLGVVAQGNATGGVSARVVVARWKAPGGALSGVDWWQLDIELLAVSVCRQQQHCTAQNTHTSQRKARHFGAVSRAFWFVSTTFSRSLSLTRNCNHFPSPLTIKPLFRCFLFYSILLHHPSFSSLPSPTLEAFHICIFLSFGLLFFYFYFYYFETCDRL